VTTLGPHGSVTATRTLTEATVIEAGPDLILVLTQDELQAFDQSLVPWWSIAVDPPAVGYAARVADGLAVVGVTVAGRRACLRSDTSLQIIEW
jgi:hypothetical protein